MHRGTIINSREDLPTMTASTYSYESTGFDNPTFHLNKQNHQHAKATNYYETDYAPAPRRPASPPTKSTNHNERAKSADYSRTSLNRAIPMASSFSSTYTTTYNNSSSSSPPKTSRLSRANTVRSNENLSTTRLSTAYIDDIRATEQESEKRELNLLNDRFGNYLNKIKTLVHINNNLRQQVDDAYRKCIGHTNEQQMELNEKNLIKKFQHPSEIQLNKLRKQINDEVRQQILIQIRLQRADYDIKFYQHNIKLLTAQEYKQSEQIRILKQQLDGSLQELEQLKIQYERREQDLQTYKNQYSEYMKKLVQLSNEYHNITYERMEGENSLYTLKEQLSFEQEYYQRRQDEFEYLEKFHYDFNKEFNKNEFHNIVKQIRQDYKEFNSIRLQELEKLYTTKLETIRNEFSKREQEQQQLTKPNDMHIAIDSVKKEHRTLIEENQLLKDKLEQLEHDLQNIIEQNRQRYEIIDKEYKQLQIELPELDCIIVHLRDNAVNLWSEINTYRYLLRNLLTTANEKTIKSPPTSVPMEKSTTTTTASEKIRQESMNTKPVINKVTTVGTKAKSHPQQYRDETTGFIVHIEDGIIWVRI